MLLAIGWVAHALPHVGQPGWGPAQAEMQTCQMPAQANDSDPMFHKYARRIFATTGTRRPSRLTITMDEKLYGLPVRSHEHRSGTRGRLWQAVATSCQT